MRRAVVLAVAASAWLPAQIAHPPRAPLPGASAAGAQQLPSQAAGQPQEELAFETPRTIFFGPNLRAGNTRAVVPQETHAEPSGSIGQQAASHPLLATAPSVWSVLPAVWFLVGSLSLVLAAASRFQRRTLRPLEHLSAELVPAAHRSRGNLAAVTMTATLPETTPSGTVVATLDPPQGEDTQSAETKTKGPSASANWWSEPGKPMLVGLSHKTAPVEVRERLSIPQREWNEAAARLCTYPGIREASILSTCNRFEVYVVAENPFAIESDVMSFLCEKSGMKTEELQPYLYFRPDTEATWHLLRTSAGLDSLVLGEGQILSQVKAMHQHAIAPASEDEPAGSAGKVLGHLLNSVVEAGKAARSETKIAQGGVSISSAAVELADLKAPTECSKPLEELRCTVAGAGTMGRLVLTHLASRGVKKVTLVSRSQSRAKELAAEYPTLEIEVREKDTLHATLEESDVAFMAVSTRGELLITKDHFDAAKEREAPLMLLDISVPRSISANCGEVPGVVAYDVDALQEAVAENTKKRQGEIVKVEELLELRKEKFVTWQNSLEYLESIKMLRAKADEVRAHLVDDALEGPLSDLTPKQQKAVQSMTNDIVNKIMHRPTKYLRDHVSVEHHEKLSVEQFENVFQLNKTWRQTAQELRDRYEPVFITKATKKLRDRYEPKELADAARDLRSRAEPQTLEDLQAMFEPKELAEAARELRAREEPRDLQELQERFEPKEQADKVRELRQRLEPSWEDVQAMFEPKELAEAARELRALYEPQSEAGAKSGLKGLRTRHVGELDTEHFKALHLADQSGFHTTDKIRWFCEEVRTAAVEKVARGQLKKLPEDQLAAVGELSEDVCNALIDPVMSYMHAAKESGNSPNGPEIDDQQLADIFELEYV